MAHDPNNGTLTTSGNNAAVLITGIAATPIDWYIQVEYMRASAP